MCRQIRIAPRNSLILVSDSRDAEMPPSMLGGLIAATSSCIAIGTLCEHDGETLISLGDEDSAVTDGQSLVFDGVLDTPNRTVTVWSVLGDPILSIDVTAEKTQVRVWANHHSEPDAIRIHVSAIP